jgi:hypothetical protein
MLRTDDGFVWLIIIALALAALIIAQRYGVFGPT